MALNSPSANFFQPNMAVEIVNILHEWTPQTHFIVNARRQIYIAVPSPESNSKLSFDWHLISRLHTHYLPTVSCRRRKRLPFHPGKCVSLPKGHTSLGIYFSVLMHFFRFRNVVWEGLRVQHMPLISRRAITQTESLRDQNSCR